MNKIGAKQKILEIIASANKLVPEKIEPDLPISGFLNNQPGWHDYEHKVWEYGEEIRQIISQHKSLRKDKEVLEKIVSVSLNRNSKRGRQSFIMLLWYKEFKEFSDKLITQLDDKGVYGHVIKVLNKMKAEGYKDSIAPFSNDKITWIRNEAKKYIEQYCG